MKFRIVHVNLEHVHVVVSVFGITNGRLIFTPLEWETVKGIMGDRVVIVDETKKKVEF